MNSLLQKKPATLNLDLRKPGLIGVLACLLLVGVFGVWTATTVIGGAVIASGQVVVRGNPRIVQSFDGGIVEEISVRNGSIVQKGQLLVGLDPTLVAINLEISRNRLAAVLALQARLQAEQSGDEAILFSYGALPFEVPDTAEHESGQREVFDARMAVLQGSRDQLAETLRQYDNQIRGVAGQITATQTQLVLLDQDLGNMLGLSSQGLARQSEISQLQQNQASLAGQLASLEAEVARITNAKHDSELSTLQAELLFKEEVVTELRDVTAQVEELTLEIVTRTAQMDRIDIRSPAAGIVHEMQVSTEGEVLAPGATLLEIIPLEEGMDFELRVDPRSIDQVYPGQAGQVFMASFDPQTTPRLNVQVSSVSPDAIVDPGTGQRFYRVGLTIAPEELDRLVNVDVMPGMPVEAYLETEDRTVLNYLVRPFSVHLRRAFRE